MDEIVVNIKKYLKIINTNTEKIEQEHEGLLEFAIGEVLDRVQLYLNSETIPTKLERILANIVNTGLKRCLNNLDNTAVDQVVTSISDNGQSISYANEVTKYFTTVSDEELFTGFSGLLSRYRRVKVVYPAKNEN